MEFWSTVILTAVIFRLFLQEHFCHQPKSAPDFCFAFICPYMNQTFRAFKINGLNVYYGHILFNATTHSWKVERQLKIEHKNDRHAVSGQTLDSCFHYHLLCLFIQFKSIWKTFWLFQLYATCNTWIIKQSKMSASWCLWMKTILRLSIQADFFTKLQFTIQIFQQHIRIIFQKTNRVTFYDSSAFSKLLIKSLHLHFRSI